MSLQNSADALLALESRVMRAIASKDRAALDPILSDAFVLRMPGADDVGKDAFLESVGALPGEIQSMHGEGTRAAVFGETGIVTGVQVATVRLAEDGKVVTSRGAFTDVFVREAGGWRLVLAFSVELPEAAV